MIMLREIHCAGKKECRFARLHVHKGYHTAGVAYANIFALRGCTWGGFSWAIRIEKPGDESAETIFGLNSPEPGGVGGEADDAGDVFVEYEGDGVSGVVGGVAYKWDPCGGGGCDGLGGEGFCWPNMGIGLVV